MIIRSDLFSSFSRLRFGMSTRGGGVSPEPYGMNLSFNVGDDERNVIANREKFFGDVGIGLNALAMTRQVHGDTVTRVRGPGSRASCDALISDDPGVFLAITVADCLPVFLFDPVTLSVAAVHIGWRGSKLRILEKALRGMAEKFGAKAGDLISFIGPSARVCCYEVGEEVAIGFPENVLRRTIADRAHLDLMQFNRNILLEAGVRGTHIEVSPHCTICNGELFHSYRREGKKSGRMMGVIGVDLERKF